MSFEIFFAASFESFMPIKKDKIPDKKIVAIIIVRFCNVNGFKISFIATAAPERVLVIL